MHLVELFTRFRIESGNGTFERVESAQGGRVAGGELAHLDECSDDVDAHLHGKRTIENHRGHDCAVFGEDPWLISSAASSIARNV